MLFSHWPIRNKLQLGLGLLAVSVLTLFGSAYYGLYAYRGLVKSLSARSAELPLAEQAARPRGRPARDPQPGAGPPAARRMFATLSANEPDQSVWDADGLLRQKYRTQLDLFCQTLDRLPRAARRQPAAHRRRHRRRQLRTETLAKIDDVLGPHSAARRRRRPRLAAGQRSESQPTARRRRKAARAGGRAAQPLARAVPRAGVRRPHAISLGHRRWPGSRPALATLLLVAAVQLFRKWIARPLATLVEGSREVAAGKFDHRIHLDSDDEMGELAEAMNAMTARFQEIRDDLDCQVRERTKQVVRSEQLASVGFLAAGVAHEINNPLASIAMCSESLEGRLSRAAEPGRRQLMRPSATSSAATSR